LRPWVAAEACYACNFAAERTPVVRYFLAGVAISIGYTATIIGLVEWLGWTSMGANAVSFTLWTPVSYLAHREFTFRFGGEYFGSPLRFGITFLVKLSTSVIIMAAVTHLGAHYLVGVLLNWIVIPLIAYIMLDSWVFRHREWVKRLLHPSTARFRSAFRIGAGRASRAPEHESDGKSVQAETNMFRWRLGSFQSAAARCLSVMLIGSTIFLVGLTFRTGIDRKHDSELVLHGAHFMVAVCAILSVEKYEAGRYVCAGNAHRAMEDIGLGYEERTLGRLGKTLGELWRDTAFLNDGLKKVFEMAPLTQAQGGEVSPIGWGMDAGYMDFVDLAFRLFGLKIESLYFGFFLLLIVSTALACIQFHDRFFVLFSLLSFQYVLFIFLQKIGYWQMYSFTNARFLSILAIIPLFHALFIILYQVRPSGPAIMLFLPQAALMAAAADFRTTAYWTAIALALFCTLLISATLWRGLSYRSAVARCWPALPVFVCLVAATVFGTVTADPRLAGIGGMKGHSFWQPLYYNLQVHPDWKRKYSEQHEGVSGDETTRVAVKAYRKRHPLLESEPLTQLSYENQTRSVLFEFIRNDPWYFIQLKYYNAATIVKAVKAFLSPAWTSLSWPFLSLAGCTAIGLAVRVRTKAESLSTLTWCTITVVTLVAIVAAAAWVTVITAYTLADTVILAAAAAFLAALWLVVSIVVLVQQSCVSASPIEGNDWINRWIVPNSAASPGQSMNRDCYKAG
jgi:putative flippase GtrA